MRDISILVVDDDPSVCEALEDEFAMRGYTVHSLTDGDRLLTLNKFFRPEVLLIDTCLYDTKSGATLEPMTMLGPYVLRRLLRHPPEHHPPLRIGMSTAAHDTKFLFEGKELPLETVWHRAGAHLYIPKPYKAEDTFSAFYDRIDSTIKEWFRSSTANNSRYA